MAETFTAGDEVAPLGEITSGAQMTSQTIVKDGVRLELLWWARARVCRHAVDPAQSVGADPPVVRGRFADAEARLVALGAEVIESMRTHIDTGSGTVDLVFLTDPDGTRIEIVKLGGSPT